MVSKLSKIILFSLFAVIAFGCSFMPPTSIDYDVGYDFSKLKTYAWITRIDHSKNKNSDEKVNTEVVTLKQKRQISAVESILASKGFIKSDSIETADFLVKNHNVTDKKRSMNTFYSTWGYYPFFHGLYMWPHQSSNSTVREYEVGTQVLDFVDVKSREVIWRGSVSQRLSLNKNQTPEDRNKRILINVELMLKSFPPEIVK